MLTLLVLVLGVGLVAACGPADDDPDPADDAQYEYNDGVFEAVSDESRGYARVRLFISRDEILEADIIEYDNTGMAKDPDVYGGDRYTMLPEAHETLKQQIVQENTWDVDTVTDATSTSDKVRQAAQRAMEKALVERPDDGEYFDGTFMGVSEQGPRGWGIAIVTIENDEIVGVQLEETTVRRDEDGEVAMDAKQRALWDLKDEDYQWDQFHEAQEAIAEAIVEAQDPQVDVYSEATSSSLMWMEAVEDALQNATR